MTRRPSPAFWMELPDDDEQPAQPDQFYIRDRKTGVMRRLELAYVSPGDADGTELDDEDDDDDEVVGRLQ